MWFMVTTRAVSAVAELLVSDAWDAAAPPAAWLCMCHA